MKIILNTCKSIPKDSTRNITRSILKLQEEVGELSKEVNIKLGNLPEKQKGIDGIIGEACDVIISAIDIMYLDNPSITSKEIENKLKYKLNKWSNLKTKL